MNSFVKYRFIFCLLLVILSVGLFPLHAQNAEESFSSDFYPENTEIVSENSQENISDDETSVEETDLSSSEDESENFVIDAKKNYIVALGAPFLISGFLGTWNRLVTDSSWAQVTFNSMIHFYKKSYEFDNDYYWTNFVLHPYQGGLSYMAARNCNLNFFESSAIALLGSTMWEYFFELTPVSYNDLIYTPIGGIAVGEMLYRLSLEADRFNNAFGIVLNPMRIYTDPILRREPSGSTGNIRELWLSLGIGGGRAKGIVENTVLPEDGYEQFPVFGSGKFGVVYGNPYGYSTNDPYSQFELEAGFSLGKGSGYGSDDLRKKLMYEISIESNGLFWSRGILKDRTRTTLGLGMDYDFTWSNLIVVSTLAPGFFVKQKVSFDRSYIAWQLHTDWLLFGTSGNYLVLRGLSDLSGVKYWRNYNYMTGFQLVAKFDWDLSSKYHLSLNYHGYYGYEFPLQKVSYTSTGWELINIFKISYERIMEKGISLGATNEFYCKKTFSDTLNDNLLLVDSLRCYIKKYF